MAIPKFYMTDQPNLEAHRSDFNDRLTVFKTEVIGETERLLNGNNPINELSLEELEKKWLKSAKDLTYNKDSSSDNHFERPITVCVCVFVSKYRIFPDLIFLLN